MKRVKSRLLAGILSVAMAFSVVAVPIEALAATDTNGHWAESTINSWINSGYISGYPDGTFRPNNAISRAEFVTIANKAFGFTSSQGISFNDVKPGYWAYSEIQKGVAAGYIQGDTIGTFRPGSAVSRQEAAVMLANLRGYASDEGAAYNYTDRWAMANWATGAIGAVSRNGVMSGYPDGTFRPQQALTRAEAVASLQKIATSSNSFDTSVNNSNYTPPVYVTPSSNNSTYNNTTSNDDTFTGTILEGTRLENRTLTKDLLIPHSVGSQNITLKNIRMKGTLYIEGGNTITLDNCNIGTVVMNKSNAVLKNNGSSDVDEVRFEEKGRIDGKGYMNVLIDDDTVSEIIIDADIDTLILDADVDLKLYANANIDTFEITKNADTARIRIGEDAEVMEMEIYDKVRISGKGKIDTMTVYVSGVRSEIQPRRLIQQDNARKPNFNYKDDDDDDDDDYDNLTLDDDDEKFDGDDEKYNRVKIAAEDVTVKNLTAYDDLTITSAAGDSTIELEGVTVKGNVYIDGGGDNSVIFDNCSISGSIYSRKSTSGRYDEAVAIKLRDTSVKGDIYVTGDTILESDEKLNKVILNKELSKTFRMDADADNLVINYNNDVQIRGSHTINAVEVVAGLTNVTITMNGGKFNTLTTRSPIKLEGTGTIDKLFTGQTNDISSGITIGSTEPIGGGTQPPSSNYVITSSISGTANGTITPLGQQTVAGGTTKEFNITANTGYHVASIVINGSQVNLDGKLYQTYKYTFYNVSSNHDIIVSFEAGAGTDGNGSASNGSSGGDVNAGDYIISATPGPNGSVDNVMVSVKSGEDASVKFIAEKDYHISEIIIDKDTENEKSLRKISESTETYKQVTYTFKNVTQNHTIHAVFDVGEGINEIGISSEDPDDPTIKPSGYKYEIKTRLVNERTGKELTVNDENRYYCIAGDTVGLRITDFVTDDPNKEYLQTKWVVVNNTAGMEMDLTQKDGETAAILQTKEGSGYAAIVKVQIYDTSDESNISMPIASSEVAELHVDVPLKDFNLSVENATTYQYMLSAQNFIFSPANASASNNKENIIWEVVSFGIDEVASPLFPGDTKTTAEIVNISDGKNGSIPSVRVEQYYKESASSQSEKLVQQPTGTVVIGATIPNGKGNLIDDYKEFTINFIGTKVVPVTSIEINGTDKQELKQAQGIQDVDLTKIITTVRPSDATYKSVEWKIIDPTDDSLGKIKQDKNNKNTILETSGRPGQLKLQPYIKSGGEEGKTDFIADADEYITVNVTPVAPTVQANSINGSSGTDADDEITLSAKVTNANKTPYTEIVGWQKTYKENAKDDEWETVSDNISDITELDDGSYTTQYTVLTDDLNQTSHYTGKTVYFRAIGEYEIYSGANIIKQSVHSNTVSVVCKAESIQFPGKTDSDQNIDSKVTGDNRVYTISGYDTVTLPPELPNQPDKTITWRYDGTAPAEDVAKLDGNILTVKGKPNETFTLSGEVLGKGPTKFKIQTAFVAIDKGRSSMSVVDKDGVAISSVNTNEEVDLNRMTINPKNASYFSNPTVTWRISETKESTGESIETQSGKYVIPDKYKGKTIYFYVAWQNGIMDGDNSAPLVSNPYEIKVNGDEKITVTGLNFDELTTMEVKGTTPNYTAAVNVADVGGKNISFGNVKYQKEDGSNSRDNLVYSVDGGQAVKNSDGTITIANQTHTEPVKIKFNFGDGNSTYVDTAGNSYSATLTITVNGTVTPSSGGTTTSIDSSPTNIQSPSAGEASIGVISENTTTNENVTPENTITNENNTTNTNTENQNNITAVTDIAFSDIKGLQAPIAPATTYNMTSSSNENIVLYLADNKNTINGITTHTGVKVLPENATYKNVTWKVKEGTLLAPSTVANVVNVTNIGSLNQNTNTFTVNANASGTVTLVATIANGKGQNNNFVKELTIRITAPNNASQSSVVPSDTTSSSTTSSNETSSSANMTKASARQVVSVGTTQVGTSSISSAGGSQTSQNSTKNTTTSIINHSEVKIETSGQCRKNISIPLKAVSKTTQQEYTDVEWEIVDDGNTGAKISNKNRLRASKTGTVTVKATVYTPSNEKMECSTNIVISN